MGSKLSELSGEMCFAATLVRRQKHLRLLRVVAVVGGALVPLLTRQWILGLIGLGLIVTVVDQFTERRIVGVSNSGLVQAKSAPFVVRPTELLPGVALENVQAVEQFGGRSALLHIDGTPFQGGRGSDALARVVQSRQS